MTALIFIIVFCALVVWFFISAGFASRIGSFLCKMWSKIVGNEDK